MKLRLALGVCVFAFLGAHVSARTLHWRSLEVQATLDGDGVLHVLERQNIVFDGDWNGGERRFRLEPGQQLTLASVTRIDPETGAKTPLADGNLSQVDAYSFVDSKTLRWRSRLASDPPFSNREIDYVLDYTLSGILEKRGGGYRLDHNFVFPERDGPIEHFTLDLALDPSWKATPALPGHWEAGPLPPGRGFVVSASLQSSRSVAPSAIRTVPLLADRRLAMLLIGFALLVFGVHYWLHDRARGRFAPLLPVSQVDHAWLKANVFDILPEEVGTAIDDDVGSPEVAAILARLVAEKKLQSETTSGAGGKTTLRLTRLADGRNLSGYEKALVDGLFFGEETVTPDDVRSHYKSSGFNPAKLIEQDLRARLAAKGAFSDTISPPSRWRSLLFLFAAVGFGAQTIRHHVPTDAPALFAFLFSSAFCALIGLLLAKRSAESFRPFGPALLVGVVILSDPLDHRGRTSDDRLLPDPVRRVHVPHADVRELGIPPGDVARRGRANGAPAAPRNGALVFPGPAPVRAPGPRRLLVSLSPRARPRFGRRPLVEELRGGRDARSRRLDVVRLVVFVRLGWRVDGRRRKLRRRGSVGGLGGRSRRLLRGRRRAVVFVGRRRGLLRRGRRRRVVSRARERKTVTAAGRQGTGQIPCAIWVRKAATIAAITSPNAIVLPSRRAPPAGALTGSPGAGRRAPRACPRRPTRRRGTAARRRPASATP